MSKWEDPDLEITKLPSKFDIKMLNLDLVSENCQRFFKIKTNRDIVGFSRYISRQLYLNSIYDFFKTISRITKEK